MDRTDFVIAEWYIAKFTRKRGALEQLSDRDLRVIVDAHVPNPFLRTFYRVRNILWDSVGSDIEYAFSDTLSYPSPVPTKMEYEIAKEILENREKAKSV